MTMDEASNRYHIPINILKEYESWGLCGEVEKVMGMWNYDDSDLQRLSLMMTLFEIGYCKEEVTAYMSLFSQGPCTRTERMHMLSEKKNCVLKEIHRKEKQLDRLAYLQHKLQKEINRNDQEE